MIICPICSQENPNQASHCSACGTPITDSEPVSLIQNLAPGTQLHNGVYSIDRVLGKGGFGITYTGNDLRLRRRVAIKELFIYGRCIRQGKTVQTETNDYSNEIQKFIEEAQRLSQFNHPGIVKVYNCFEENKTAYMVMEFLEGKTLSHILQEAEGNILPESDAVGYICRAAEALEVVHQANILHRDIKPDNIILTNDSRVVLLDFGAAREFVAGKVKTQSVILTEGYAPLEQEATQAERGPFTDIYALGATLYHLITGELPVSPKNRVLGANLVPPDEHRNARNISKTVSDAVMWAMKMKANERPQSASEFIKSLIGQRKAPKDVQTANTPFKFNNNESANSIVDLIELCDKYPSKAEEFLFNGYIESWLGGNLGQPDLAKQIRDITNNYPQAKRKGLEFAVRLLCKEATIDPYPQLSATPSRLNLGTIPVGKKASTAFQLSNQKRGFAWGSVRLNPNHKGLKLSTDNFRNLTEKPYLELDTLYVQPGTYHTEITIQGEGLPTPCRIPVEYTVQSLKININPPRLDLGTIPYGKQASTTLNITCTPSEGKLKGTASTKLSGLQITKQDLSNQSTDFEGSLIDLNVTVNTRVLEAGKNYEDKIYLKTNAGELEIPVQFQTNIRFDLIAIRTLIFGLGVSSLMGITRSTVGNTAPQLKQFLLFYPNFKGLFEFSTVQFVCAGLGLGIVLVWFLVKSWKKT